MYINKILVVALLVALIVAGVFGSMQYVELIKTKSQLSQVQTELAYTQARLEWTEDSLSANRAELNEAKQELAQTQTKVESLSQELEVAQQRLASYKGNEYPREFSSVMALREWLRHDKTNEMAYIPNKFDCDDFAYTLMCNALRDGYLMSTEIVEMGGNITHMLCTTPIGNTIYQIEPQTDLVTVVGPRDTRLWR